MGCGPARLDGRPGCGQARGQPQRHLQVLGKTECQNSQGRGDSGVRTTWLDTEQVRPLLPGSDNGQGGVGGPQVLPMQAPAPSPRFWQKGQDSCACKCSDLCGFLADWSLALEPTLQKLPRSGPERGGLNPVLMCGHLGSFPFLLCSVSHWPLGEEHERPEPPPGAKRPGSLAGRSGAWVRWGPGSQQHPITAGQGCSDPRFLLPKPV